MDLATILWLDSKPEDELGSSDDVPADFDDNEDAWNDQRRRERLAEVEYDC
jgi:hypothetical protein